MADPVPLGVIADKLEEMSYPGSAGAVRALEFVLGRPNATQLEIALLHAELQLENAGHREMLDSLDAAYRALMARQSNRKRLARERRNNREVGNL